MTFPKRRLLGFAFLLFVVAFGAGLITGNRSFLHRKKPTFHDLRINHIRDFLPLVEPKDGAIRALAAELKTPEAAYAFVRDRIRFVPASRTVSSASVLLAGEGSCMGKAVLLCSLYRALGFPPSAVRVITGNISISDYMTDHAWVDLEYKGRCFQQDASGMFGLFDFGQFPGLEYSRAFVLEEDFCFNDKGFAVVSQLNLIRGMPAESMHPPTE